MNSIHLLQQYVEHQNQRWLSMEMDKGRGVDLADVEDPRVDLCLFCIQSHRLRPVDLRSVCSAVAAMHIAYSHQGMIYIVPLNGAKRPAWVAIRHHVACIRADRLYVHMIDPSGFWVAAEETAAAEPFHGRIALHTSLDLRAKCPVHKSVHASADPTPCCAAM